jgi:hypothetical protein
MKTQIKPNMDKQNIINISDFGNECQVELVSHKKINSIIKAIPECRFDKFLKTWIIPKKMKESLINGLKDIANIQNIKAKKIAIKPEIHVKLERRSGDENDCNSLTATIQKYNDAFPYIDKVLDVFRSIPDRYFDKDRKEWVFNGSLKDQLIEGLQQLMTDDTINIIINDLT